MDLAIVVSVGPGGAQNATIPLKHCPMIVVHPEKKDTMGCNQDKFVEVDGVLGRKAETVA